jgi:hypothetical protein
MRKIDPRLGKVGVGIRVSGVVLAWLANWLYTTQAGAAILLMGIGSSIYLLGGFLAVAAFGYSRQGSLFWSFTTLRLAFAGAVILLVMRIASGGV